MYFIALEGVMMNFFSLMPCLFITIFSAIKLHANENDLNLGNLWLNGADQGREILFFQEGEVNYAECSILKKNSS